MWHGTGRVTALSGAILPRSIRRQRPPFRVLMGAAVALSFVLFGTVSPAAGVPLSLTLLVQPTSAFPLIPFPTQPVIGFSVPTTNPGIGNGLSAQLADSTGAPIFGSLIAQLSMGAPCLNNKCVVGVPFGSPQISFSALSINRAGMYRLIFTLEPGGDDISLGAVVSNPFVVGTGVAAQLRSKGAVAGAAKSRPLNQLHVELEDAGGNALVTNSTDAISLQILDAGSLNPPTNGAVLQGATRATLASGVASFAGLSVGTLGDYVLRATATTAVPPLDVRGPKYSPSPLVPDMPLFVRDRQFVISSSPTGGKAGQPLDAVNVQLIDSGGSVVNSNESVVLHLVQNGIDRPFNYAGTSTTTATTTMIVGTAVFAGIVIPASTGAGTYTFVAEAAPSNELSTRAQMGNVGNTAPGASPQLVIGDRQLVFASQPGKANAGLPLDQIPIVSLVNSAGIPIGTSGDTVTMTLSNAPWARLAGTGCASDGRVCMLTLINGGAAFTSFSVDTPGTYTLTATTSAVDGSGNSLAAVTSGTFTITGVALTATPAPAVPPVPSATSPPVSQPLPPASVGFGSTPSLSAAAEPPPNTNLATIRGGLPILADIPAADVVFDYFGPSAVVSQLLQPPLATMPLVSGCYSGPNATAQEQGASLVFGFKPAGSQFIIFFIRGTRGYSFDVAVGNYCWIDLM